MTHRTKVHLIRKKLTPQAVRGSRCSRCVAEALCVALPQEAFGSVVAPIRHHALFELINPKGRGEHPNTAQTRGIM